MFYFIIYLIILFCAFRVYKHTDSEHIFKKNRLICLWIFILVAGLRYEIGIDFFSYVERFEESPYLSEIFTVNGFEQAFLSSWEPLSSLYFIVLHSLTGNSQIVFFITSIICSILLFKSFDYFCERKNYLFSVLIYFSFVYLYQEMHALRQALGASMLYWGLIAYSEKKYVQTIASLIIAICFHYSMALFIPIMFFLNKRCSTKAMLYLLFLAFFVFFLKIRWMNYVIEAIANFIPEAGVAIRLLNYLNADSFERPFFLSFVLYLFPFLLLLYFDYKYKLFKDRKYVIAKNMYFLYLIFTMIFWEYSFFSIRYGWICLWGMAVCLPMMQCIFTKSSRVFVIGYIILFCFVTVKTFLFPTMTTKQFVPYDNYILCEWFGFEATGAERAEEYLNAVTK